MGLVHAEIELINGYDFASARKHLIGEEEIDPKRQELVTRTPERLHRL